MREKLDPELPLHLSRRICPSLASLEKTPAQRLHQLLVAQDLECFRDRVVEIPWHDGENGLSPACHRYGPRFGILLELLRQGCQLRPGFHHRKCLRHEPPERLNVQQSVPY